VLRDNGYAGVLSMECEGASGPMIEKSLAWLRKTLRMMRISHLLNDSLRLKNR
jgi:hypothetical protein